MGPSSLHTVGQGWASLLDDTDFVQRLQVIEGVLADGQRVIDNVPNYQNFGFSSVPPLGSDILMVRLAGDRSMSFVVGVLHRDSRLRNLSPGDSAQYDVRGQKITITSEGIEIDGAGLDLPVTIKNVPKLRVEAIRIECTGDIVADVDGAAISLKALHDAYNAHGHPGVQAGGASTGGTDHPA